MIIQDLYQKAIRFAAERHALQNQKLPDSIIPYAVHLSNVAMEIIIAANQSDNFDVNLAVQIALLHDVLEDTATTSEDIEMEFGQQVANGVQALTKNENLPKKIRMTDSLIRLKTCRPEVRAVKVADRITNLQPPPPSWSAEKRQHYLQEAEFILTELAGTNAFLEQRLLKKIEEYRQYL